MERTTWITSINKIRQDIMKNDKESINALDQSMVVNKLTEALLWLHRPAIDIHIDKVARDGTGPITGQEIFE